MSRAASRAVTFIFDAPARRTSRGLLSGFRTPALPSGDDDGDGDGDGNGDGDHSQAALIARVCTDKSALTAVPELRAPPPRVRWLPSRARGGRRFTARRRRAAGTAARGCRDCQKLLNSEMTQPLPLQMQAMRCKSAPAPLQTAMLLLPLACCASRRQNLQTCGEVIS
jgi:hypothetical protein